MAIKPHCICYLIRVFILFFLLVSLLTLTTTAATLENATTDLNNPPQYHIPQHRRMLFVKRSLASHTTFNLERKNRTKWRSSSDELTIPTKRRLIGSMAPTCTYNECRGCKYRCRAEQIPVDGNDPINSPYHYKCVCHRP